MMDGHQSITDGCHGGKITGCPGILDLCTQPGSNIGGHRNATDPTLRIKCRGGRVLTGQLDKVGSQFDPCPQRSGQITRRVLDTDDIGQQSQTRHGRHRHVDDAASGDVVNDNRQFGRIMDGLEMLIKPFLRRLVIVGCDDEGGISPDLPGIAGQADGLFRRVGPGAGDNRNLSLGNFNRQCDDESVFLMTEGRRLPGGATGNETMRAFIQLPLHEILKGSLIHPAVTERREQRNNGTLEHDAPCRSWTQALTDNSLARKARTITVGPDLNKGWLHRTWTRARNSAPAFLSMLIAALFITLAVSRPVLAEISNTDTQIYKAAFKAAAGGRHSEARQIAGRARQDLPAKVLEWMALTDPQTEADWTTLNAFLDQNPGWPNLAAIRRNAEGRMPNLPAKEVRAWYEKRPPLTTAGFNTFIEALVATGASDRAITLVRDRYVDGSFGVVEERDFRKRFNSMLRPVDHWNRLDRLLWDNELVDAKRVMPLVDKGRQQVALARIALSGTTGGSDGALRKVPPALQNDAGLLYERLRWRRRKDQDTAALEILARPPKDLIRPDVWWQERHIMARRLMEAGKHRQAYQLVVQHGTKDGLAFAQAEFLAGWLALRFLDKPTEALKHFEILYRGVTSPLSKGRGAYWAGRALSTAGDEVRAKSWYEAALTHGPTFYGHLAADRLGKPGGAIIPGVFKPDEATLSRFNRLELVRLVRMLNRIEGDSGEITGQFLRRLVSDATDDSTLQLLGLLATEVGDARQAVLVSRQALQAGSIILSGFPLLSHRLPPRPDPALVHAIVRQETNFQSTAVSSAGARGLMQLMPATAQQLAREAGLKHSSERLTSDPEYNVRLGSAYLQELVERYDGSYIMAIAAYNAGPGRVAGWLKEVGDPRTESMDAVDWIELIPIYETRNYVQRVLENAQIYRTRLQLPPVRMSDDLKRGRTGDG
jgi:soluble lytic murein transglycosylase